MKHNNKKLVNFLEDNGPTMKRKLRDITKTPPRRYNGVHELRINPSRSKGASSSASGKPLPIVYLDKHKKRKVLEVWAEYHQDMIDRISTDAIYRATPHEFRDAMREIINVDDYYSDRGGDNSGDAETCDLCGETYTGDLPTHIRNDCQSS
jgi:hypothetical protein